MKRENSIKLSQKELKELLGGTIYGGTSSQTGDVLNKNGGNDCVCTYKNMSLITNQNPPQTTCRCICN